MEETAVRRGAYGKMDREDLLPRLLSTRRQTSLDLRAPSLLWALRHPGKRREGESTIVFVFQNCPIILD
jgi:hypothetical protein